MPHRRAAGHGAKTASLDRKSTRLNSSHPTISYAVFCLKNNLLILYRTLFGADYRPSPSIAGQLEVRENSPDAKARQAAALVQTAIFFLMKRRPPRSTPFPSTALFR